MKKRICQLCPDVTVDHTFLHCSGFSKLRESQGVLGDELDILLEMPILELRVELFKYQNDLIEALDA